MDGRRLSGVLCPVITPFKPDLSPDAEKFVAQCQWLISQGVGLAVFGTNSEANSLSVDEKISLLDALVAAGIDPQRLLPGSGSCSLADAVRLTAHAVQLGCAGALVLPPFFYKPVSDGGLYNYFSEVIERVNSTALKVYLYDIAPLTKVPLSPDLIGRLVESYPNTIVGIKDSSGDWSNTEQLLARNWEDFRVFVGSETFLLQNMRNGGAGCISATANINPAPIRRLFQEWQSAEADTLQSQLNTIREIAMRHPMIPTLKATVAHFSDDNSWLGVRPPLVSLSSRYAQEVVAELIQNDFDMPGLGSSRSG